ncbi:cohesin domain-containing protein [Hydrogenophaga sp. BPS33]|uniref:cohesin domain-containing protein n=1 Tax=Hydrogenophaga sp. BPS33 TaxID=2651974 RepID=UPI00131FB091|nr:cohesin domain-containing protein [Hydrogenophaga sp. BPS33]QHE86656.1 general secretion pathway protein GspD [Hydrogenophaga sp. BPS33]
MTTSDRWRQRVARFKWVVAMWVLAIGLAGCAQQRIREEASTQLREGQYESALATLKEGVARYPDSALLRAGLHATRGDVVARLVAQAVQERMQGRLDAAVEVLERARKLEPENPRVADLLADLRNERHVQNTLEVARQQMQSGQKEAALRTLEGTLAVAPRHAELLSLKRQLETEQRLEAGASAHRLALAETRPISLDFRDAPLSFLLEALRDGSGINFVVDRDVQMDQRASVFIRSTRVEDALDLVLSAYQLSRRIVDPKTVLVYPNTPEKHKEHREQVIRVFHLAHAQAKSTASLLQTMLRIQPPFVDERANFLALRESPDIVALAERLVALHDLGEAEVMLEVEVLEVKTTRLTELGIHFPSSLALTPLPLPGQTGLTVDSVRSLNSGRVGVSVAGLLINLRREVGDFNTLANPRIRSRSREKATILIGDKVPVITTTAGTGGFVSENVNYLDVGLKLEVEPIVSPDDDVTIKLGLEVSSLAGEVRTAGGSVAYRIGTRNANTQLRLRDGETQLLGGLISNEDRTNANRVPGLGDLPLAGRLFSSQKDDVQRTELVLAITPRILRSAARPDVAMAEMWVGTESFTRLRPSPAMRVASAASSGTASSAAPTASARATAAQPPALASGLDLKFTGPPQVKAGDTFALALHATSGVPLAGLPLSVGFSSDTLQVVGVAEGDYFKQSPAPSSFTHAVNAPGGRISVGVLSGADKGVRGEGDVMLIRFKALRAGAAEVRLETVDPLGLSGVVPAANKPAFKLQIE